MSKVKICSVVTGKTLEDFYKSMKEVQDASDFVELRVDYIKDFKAKDLIKIKDRLFRKSILTCRSKFDGGEFMGSVDDQNEILQMACDLGFDYIDVDLRIFNDIKLKKKNTKVICSFHDFGETPEESELDKIFKVMKKTSADIYKFAVLVRKEADLNLLYRLLINKDPKDEMIVIGMGKRGQPSRIVSPLLGGYLTFAAVGKSASAPGQIDIEDMKKVYEGIGV